jgi:hypothetical protein
MNDSREREQSCTAHYDTDNNNSSLDKRSLEYHPDHQKDEYLDDPLPDLVGNLQITEEPEPDLTILDHEFVLEDFEFNVTSDEEDDESSGSDLEFYDAATNSSDPSSEGLLPENENVSVELDQNFSINNCDNNETPTPGPSNGAASGTMRARLGNVKETARKVAASVKGMVGKSKVKGKNIRVTYHNLDKPYTARVSPAHQFKNFLTLGEGRVSFIVVINHKKCPNRLLIPIFLHL